MTWAPDYTTLTKLKDYVRVDDLVDDVQLAMYITAASRAIDNHCNRQFGRVASSQERLYTASYNYRRRRWVVLMDDLMPVTGSVVVETSDGVINDYALEPTNAGLYEGMPYTRIAVRITSVIQPTSVENGVAITTEDWGWSAVPAAVELACLLQSNRFAVRRDSPFGIAGSPDQGNEMRLLSRVD